jgi:hypothetical protein
MSHHIYLRNSHSDLAYKAHIRCAIDWTPPFKQGTVPDRCNFVVGNPTGLDTRTIDLYTEIGPWALDCDFSTAVGGNDFQIAPLPDDWFEHFGGPMMIGNTPMSIVSITENGAAWDIHWRARVGTMLVVDVWAWWYPTQPGWCVGSVKISAGNPTVPDVVAYIPPDFTLRWGDGVVFCAQKAPGAPLMDAGDWIADGQPRILTDIVFLWPRLAKGDDHIAAYLYGIRKMGIRGLERLHRDGNPYLPPGFDAQGWANNLLPSVINSTNNWIKGPLDPNYESDDPGAQAGQSFCCGPAMADPSAVPVIVLSAADMHWPLCHIEANGALLDYKRHNTLRLHYGRVNRPISGETLGKDTEPTLIDTHRFHGWQEEHAFDFPLFAGARLSGDPALQWLLGAWGRQIWWNFPVEPEGDYTFPNRAEGWWALAVTELWRNLRDRDFAVALRNRTVERLDRLVIPRMLPGDAWWSWKEDSSIGADPAHPRAIPWQACVMARGLKSLGDALDHAGARDMALHMATTIVDRIYVQRNGRWTSRDVIQMDGNDPEIVGAYDQYGTPMVLGINQTTKDRDIVAQYLRESTTWQSCAWLSPGAV